MVLTFHRQNCMCVFKVQRPAVLTRCCLVLINYAFWYQCFTLFSECLVQNWGITTMLVFVNGKMARGLDLFSCPHSQIQNSKYTTH